MIERMRCVGLVWVILAVGCASDTMAQQGVSVDRKPADVKRRTFNPDSPPKEMPPLTPPEAAVTTSSFSIAPQVTVSVVGDRKQNGKTVSEVKVEQLNVALTLSIVVWVPIRAAAELREHEEAHRRISESFYEKAGEVVRGIASEYVGKTYCGEGKDEAAARDAAMKKVIGEISQRYLAKVQAPSSRVNELFDEITDHGRNREISADEGVERAMERYKRELRGREK